MIAFALLKPNGCIDLAGISRQPPPGYVALPPGLTPEFTPYLMYVDGQWQERPVLPEWQKNGHTVTLPVAPDETSVEVFDHETDALLGRATAESGSLTLDLPDSGTYRLETQVPDPWAPCEPQLIEIE